jgi:hypothetical protein
MRLEEILRGKKPAIEARWLELLLESYPGEGARFWQKEENEFANPVGHVFREALPQLYQALLGEEKVREVARPALDRILQIRAVQDLTPGRAVAFVLDLKKLLRQELAESFACGEVGLNDFLTLESRIDDLTLEAFDSYVACVKKIADIRVKELQHWTYRLLQKADLLAEVPIASTGEAGAPGRDAGGEDEDG